MQPGRATYPRAGAEVVASKFTAMELKLLALLLDVRKVEAGARGIGPYTVASRALVEMMTTIRPKSLDQLARLPGSFF